jgi:predicted DCC family thiol-disulfide oxidoreductase YuxK
MPMKALALAAVAVSLLGCAPSHTPSLGSVLLRTTDGAPVPVDEALRAHPYTVVTFFSAECPCQRAHDARLRALIAKDAPHDVGFLVVDSEESATLTRDAGESKARGYPILVDDAGKLAGALGAEFATYSVVLDREGKVLYRGAFDSDRVHLREAAAPFLDDALADALSGRPVKRPETKTLGCTLQLR